MRANGSCRGELDAYNAGRLAAADAPANANEAWLRWLDGVERAVTFSERDELQLAFMRGWMGEPSYEAAS